MRIEIKGGIVEFWPDGKTSAQMLDTYFKPPVRGVIITVRCDPKSLQREGDHWLLAGFLDDVRVEIR